MASADEFVTGFEKREAERHEAGMKEHAERLRLWAKEEEQRDEQHQAYLAHLEDQKAYTTAWKHHAADHTRLWRDQNALLAEIRDALKARG